MTPARLLFAGVLAVAWAVAAVPSVRAQVPGEDEGGPTVRDTGVGYIDSAIPFSNMRLRVDSAYNISRPNRAEYIYARGAPFGPGLPFAESRVDYQDIRSYIEYSPRGIFSGFIELPVRFLNPQINDAASGLGDMNLGAKWAFWRTWDTVVTGQFRTYVPSGNARLGLGNNHVSLEPGILFNHQLAELVRLEGEFLYWVPAGGTSFAGSLFQYGLGLTFLQQHPQDFWFTPVAEFVAWTVLGGHESAFHSNQFVTVESAAGDTIVNAKLGVRAGLGTFMDVYAGYGRALTGDAWYKDIFRVEFRVRF